MARDDRSQEFVGVLGFFIAICTLLVVLRCYCKVFIVKNFAADDALSLLTLVSFLVFCTLALLGTTKGTGRRRYLIADEDYPDGMKWWWSCEPTYVFSNLCLKASIGIFLLRIAVERTHRLILWVSIISVELYGVFFLLLFTFQCWPISHFWEQFRGAKGHCMNTNIVVNSFYGYSAISCVTDWTFSIVPIFIVRGLQMNNRKKWTVAVILAFCAIGSTATIVRLPFIQGLNDVNDFLYSTIDVAIWSTCETGIGLATSATATLRPLLRQVFGEHLSSNGVSTTKHASRNWGGKFPSRNGYMRNPSSNGDNDIALKEQDTVLTQIHHVSSRDLSPSGSTAGLNDWEDSKDGMHSPHEPHPLFANGGIMKTVDIHQSNHHD